MSILIADGTGGSVALPERSATRDELIAWAQGMKLTPNSAVGQLEALSSAGAVVITDPTAKTLSTTSASEAAALETSAILTTNGAVDLTKKTTKLNAGSGAFTLSLANGLYDGQEVAVRFVNGSSTAAWTTTPNPLTNLLGFTGFVLNAIGHTLRLKWDATGGKWGVEGGNALLS